MKSVIRWILISVFALSICAATSWWFYTRSQSDILHATVIRHLAKPEGGPDAPPPLRIFFVQINGQNPPPTFVEQFEKESISLRPLSQGVLTPGSFSGHMSDIQTGESGMELKFRRITWLGLKPVVHTSRYMYVMTRDYGEWRVESVVMMGG